MQRTKIIAANWKMNLLWHEAQQLLQDLERGLRLRKAVRTQVVIAPGFPYLASAQHLLASLTNVSVGAQNCHHEKQGAFTGEVSASMLASVGVKSIIVGHSERRRDQGEDKNGLIEKKISQALAASCAVILCVGEPLEVREKNEQVAFIRAQLHAALHNFSAVDLSRVAIAYEPIWAIGTGKSASPEIANDTHASIRNALRDCFGEDTAARTPILYGGSVNAKVAHALLSAEHIDGALVGGASLDASEFLEIVRTCDTLHG